MDKERNLVRVLALINDIALAAVLTVNALANILPIGGIQTGEVSDLYRNLYTPAGFTFSIWALIYLLLIAFAVFQTYLAFGPAQPDRISILDIRWWFLISSLANCLWIIAWHLQLLILSMLLMLIILGSLIAIYLSLKIGRLVVHTRVRTLIHIPFSIYLGWITAATIANAAALLVSFGWDGSPFGEDLLTILVVTAAAAIALMALRYRKDVFLAGVIGWALIGIMGQHLGLYERMYMPIIVFTAGYALLIFGICLYYLIKGKVYA